MGMREMYIGKRYFSDEKFESEYGINGKSEIVSLGCLCLDHSRVARGDNRCIFRQFEEGGLVRVVGKLHYSKRERAFVQKVKPVTQARIDRLVEKAKGKLKPTEQIIYDEKYTGGELGGYDGFEFCGYDLHHTSEGGSALYDCGEELSVEIIDRLNAYGLFDTLDDAAFGQKTILEESDYDESEYEIEIYGVWRFIKEYATVN